MACAGKLTTHSEAARMPNSINGLTRRIREWDCCAFIPVPPSFFCVVTQVFAVPHCSFSRKNHVNVLLSQVYLGRHGCASSERMTSVDGIKIIRMYEKGKHCKLMCLRLDIRKEGHGKGKGQVRQEGACHARRV